MSINATVSFGYIFKLLVFLAVFAIGQAPCVAAEEVIQADTRYLYVQPGQTLHNIVRRLYPQRQKDWVKLEQQIVRDNPEAFVDGDKTKMKAGARLELPRRMVVKPRPIARKPSQVGEVIMARGETLAINQQKVSRDLSVGDAVYVGDKIVTGEDGFLRLHMVDNARLDLRCYSIMVIEKYDLQKTNRRSILNLLQGSLRKVTGEIGKWTEDIYELKTPVASVGVRGTEYALRVFQSKGCDGSVDTNDEGLYIKVINGWVDVHNKAAKTEVAKNDTLYIPLPDKAPVEKVIKAGVFEPVKATEPVQDEPVVEEKSTSAWWWAVLGVIIIALAI
ncbi:MAG: FecR domain-containing protein [Gammaproteobacteria bacterium]